MPVYATNGKQQQCGYALGILCMDEYLPFPPGCVNNSSSFRYPVLHKLVPGWRSADVMAGATGKYLNTMIDKARELEADGVRGIISNCGYALQHQADLANAVKIPVALSSLCLLPMIGSSLGPNGAIGILCTAAPPLTRAFIESAGIRVRNPLVIEGLIDEPGFQTLAAACGLAQKSDEALISFDSDDIERDLVRVATCMQKNHPELGAILFECSEFGPYAHAVQAATELPVFDFITLADYLDSATRPPTPTGFI